MTTSAFKPIFDILSPTTHRDTIASPLMEAVAGPLRDSLTTFPYLIPPTHRPFLAEAGINISEFGTKTHPHPVHKTIELNLLNNVWRHYASAPSTILFMKPSKFEKMKDKNPNFSELLNYRLTPKDTTRYPTSATTLPVTPNVFMHDALMYYSPAQILDLFVRCPQINNLYASLVVPPESDFTHLSLNPSLYRYNFKKDDLVYFLENNPAHSYSQPRSALDWLKTTIICGADTQLTVTILDSWGPVHSLLIQRGLTPQTQPLDEHSFKVPDAVLLPPPVDLQQDIRHRLVPKAVYSLLFQYVRAVRTLRVTDPNGLIRTQSNKPEYSWVTPAAWDNLGHFALTTSPLRPMSHYLLFNTPWRRLRHWIRTNEFFLFTVSSLAALPPCTAAAALISHLSRCRIQHLALFNRWIISPPSPLNPFRRIPKAPRFALAFTPRQRHFISTSFNHLFSHDKIPSSPGFFKRWYESHLPASLPAWTIPAIIAASLIPLSVLACRWFFFSITPQASHDNYQAYLHPDPWQLTFHRKPCYCDPKPFLPFDPTAPTTLIDIPIHPLTPPAADPTPEPPSNPKPETPPKPQPSDQPKRKEKPQKKVKFAPTSAGAPQPPPTPTTTIPPPPTAQTSHIDPTTFEEVFTPATRPSNVPPPTFADPAPIDLGIHIRADNEPVISFDPNPDMHPLDCFCPIHASEPETTPFDLSASDPNYIHDLPRDINLPKLAPEHAKSALPAAPQPERVESPAAAKPLPTSFGPIHPAADPRAAMLVYSEHLGCYIEFVIENLGHLARHEMERIGLPAENSGSATPIPHNFAPLLVFSSKFGTHIPAVAENYHHLTPAEISLMCCLNAAARPQAQTPQSHSHSDLISDSDSDQATDQAPDSPRSTASIDSFGVIDFAVTPPPEPFQTLDQSLISDPTGAGEPRQWENIHPKKYAGFSGKFITRQRNGPPARLPYPPTDCLLQALSQALMIQPQTMWETLCAELPDRTIDYESILKHGLNTEHLTVLATMYDFHCTVIHDNKDAPEYGLTDSKTRIAIHHTSGSPGHFYIPTNPPQPFTGAKQSDYAHAALRFRTSDQQLLPFQRVHDYLTHKDRAKILISDMKNGFDGVLINVNPHEPNKAREAFLTLDNTIDHSRTRRVQLIHIAGFPGCGKSYPVQKLLQTPMFKKYKVAVPTTELRAEWKEAMKLPPQDNWRISTWESSLLKSAKVLVIDEVYRMPRGYLDLSIYADPNIEFVILLGDPIQGEYHSSHASSSNHRLSSEINHLAPFIDFYCLWSRRVPQDVAAFFKIQSSNPEPGFHSFSNRFPNTKILTNSTASASLLQQAGHPAITIASSQGSTYSCPVTINLDKHSRILSLQHSLIAITRSKKGNIFTGDQSVLKPSSSCNPIFANYFHEQAFDLFDAFKILNTFNIIRSPLKSRAVKLSGALTINAQSTARIVSTAQPYARRLPTSPQPFFSPMLNSLIEKLDSTHVTPSYKSDIIADTSIFSGEGEDSSPQISTHFIAETRRPLHYDIPSAAISNATPNSCTISTPITPSPVYPGESFETVAATFMPAHDPDLKEILWRDQSSNQFPYLNNVSNLSAQPMSLLAATHSPKNDPTLLPSSIEKRLRFRPTETPYEISPKDQILGSMLFSSLCRAYRRDPDSSIPFDENLYLECINANEFSQLSSKSQSTIMANAYRSDPDWRWSAVRIFAKSQHKVNEASIFGNWKACQTLALMHDAVILLLGPVKKYQRIFDRQDRPSNLYVHASHTPTDLAHWAQANMTTSTHIANDYTAFDQSQHGEAVVLEVLKMRRLNIPDHLIDLHIHLKTNVQTQFGPLTCMRLTGEPGTYDDNTDYNIAVLFSEYNITNQGVAVSGDDSIIDSEPPTRPEWSFIKPLLALRFRKECTRYGLFCGYYIGPEGAVRSPLALFAKLAIALDDDTLDDKLISYFSEFLIGHSLGQPMWNLIPIEQVMYQSANFDLFCRAVPTNLKSALLLGEPPASIINALFPMLKYLTYPIWSLLNNTQRALFSRSKKFKNQSSMQPFSASTEGELLPSFRTTDATAQEEPASLSAISDPADIIRDLEDFEIQLDSNYQPYLSANEQLAQKLFGAGQMAIPAELIAQLIKLLTNAAHSETSSQGSLESGSAPALLLPAPHIPAPARSLTSPASASPAGITMPFQSLFYDITGTETKSASLSIASLTAITDMLPHYRYAKLLELEAIIAPTGNSQKYAQTIEVVWCTADQTIADDKIMRTYGSARYAFGGPVNMPVITSHPADLKQLNAVLKDSVTYSDTPRFCVRFWENADCKAKGISAPICGSIFIRGLVHLSSPCAAPSAS